MVDEAPIPHPIEWPVVRLGDITLKIGSGATPTGGEETYLAQRAKFALIRSQNVFDRFFNSEGLAFISDEQAERLKGVALQEGDLLLNITGDGITFSRSCAVPKDVLPACVNQHVAIIRVDPALADPGYVLAYLTHRDVKPYIESFNAGGSRRAITKGHIESFRLPLPPLPEQRAIAHILGALDDKIELNRSMAETLEAMARALFKSWFADFDPVRAKSERRPTGLPDEVAAAFPDKFVGTQFGEIPQGWRLGTLDDIAETTMGLSPDGDSYNAEGTGVPLINGPVEFGDYFPVRTKWTTSPTRVCEAGDLILCVRGSTTGRRVVADGSYCLGRGVCSIRPRSVSRTFVYKLFDTAIDRLLEKTTGSVFPNLSAPDIKQFALVVPPANVVESFRELADPLTLRIEASVTGSRALAELRDTLLPRLISGELRIRDAESAIKAA